MFPSERFLARISKFRKSNRTEPVDTQIAMIRNAFIDMNRHLPASLLEGLIEHFTMHLAEGPEDSAFDRCEKLADVIDVLHEEYDNNNDPLDAEDWAPISEAVSDHADSLDMGFVTYIMMLAVDHHAV